MNNQSMTFHLISRMFSIYSCYQVQNSLYRWKTPYKNEKKQTLSDGVIEGEGQEWNNWSGCHFIEMGDMREMRGVHLKMGG